MIKSVTVINYVGESLTMDLTQPETSELAITKITGLGAGDANINVTDVSTLDGGVYNSARLSKRNIVISLRYYGIDIEAIRQKTYRFFPIKKYVTLVFETDHRIAEISGFVEKNDPDIFSAEEGSDISIICPDPYFYAINDGTSGITSFQDIEGVFEFPFSNESVASSVIEFGIIEHRTEENVIYDGDANPGIKIVIHAIGPAEDVTVHNLDTRESMGLDSEKIQKLTGSGIVAGDDIIINTTVGSKSIILRRQGNDTNILNCLKKNAGWFTLAKGDNIFAYTAESGASNLQFRIENRILYEGL